MSLCFGSGAATNALSRGWNVVGSECLKVVSPADSAMVSARLLASAFRTTLRRKQTRFPQVLAWLDERQAHAAARLGSQAHRLERVVEQGDAVFQGIKY